MRAHRNVERRLNRERLVPVLSASTLSSDFIPYPLVSSPFLANNCSSSPRLLEAEPDFRFGTLSRVSSLSLFFPFSLVFRFDYERSKEDIQESEDRYRWYSIRIRILSRFPYGRYVMSTRWRVSYTSVSHVPQIPYLSISLPLPRAKTRGKEMNFTDGGGKEKKRKEGKENVEICFHRGRKRNLQLETR